MNTRAVLLAFISILVFVLLLAIVSSVTVTESSYTGGPYIKLSMISQDPDPATPGGYVDVRLKVENWGSGAASNVSVELAPSYPLLLLDASPLKEVGSFSGVQKGPEGVIVKYRLLVEPAAPSGDAKAGLRYRVGTEWTRLEDINISVRSYETAVSAELGTVPYELVQGESGRVHVQLRNPADSFAKNINLKLDLGSSFVPINSTDFAAISRLNGKSSADIYFTVLVKPDVSSGYYALPVALSYTDAWGKNYTRNITGGIVINSPPKVYASFEEAKSKNGVATVTVRVVNNGLSDVKMLRAVLLESDGYSLVSGDEYVGELDSDDFASVEFEVSPEKEEVTLPLQLTFSDALNREHSGEFSLKASLPLSKKSGFSVTGILLTASIVVIGVLLFRRRKK